MRPKPSGSGCSLGLSRPKGHILRGGFFNFQGAGKFRRLPESDPALVVRVGHFFRRATPSAISGLVLARRHCAGGLFLEASRDDLTRTAWPLPQCEVGVFCLVGTRLAHFGTGVYFSNAEPNNPVFFTSGGFLADSFFISKKCVFCIRFDSKRAIFPQFSLSKRIVNFYFDSPRLHHLEKTNPSLWGHSPG
jgi:hypothetical protein